MIKNVTPVAKTKSNVNHVKLRFPKVKTSDTNAKYVQNMQLNKKAGTKLLNTPNSIIVMM